MEDKKLHLPNLAGLKPNNIETIFNNLYKRWRYLESSWVIINGEKLKNETYVEGIGYIERQLLIFTDKNGNPNIKSCEVSDITKSGFPLTEKTFIEEQLRKYEPMYNKTIGSKINRENHLKLELYINFLKQGGLTHRQKAIIYYFKVEGKYKKLMDRKQMKEFGGKNYEKASDSVNERSKAYKPITKKEIETILPYLSEFPEALRIAKVKLSQLE